MMKGGYPEWDHRPFWRGKCFGCRKAKNKKKIRIDKSCGRCQHGWSERMSKKCQPKLRDGTTDGWSERMSEKCQPKRRDGTTEELKEIDHGRKVKDGRNKTVRSHYWQCLAWSKVKHGRNQQGREGMPAVSHQRRENLERSWWVNLIFGHFNPDKLGRG